MSKKEIPNELRKCLDEFQVDIPEIPMKRSRLERTANWIYTPAKDPLEVLSIKGNSITQIVLYPLIFILVLCFTPIFIF